MDLNKLRDLTANDFSDPALAIIKAVLTDVFLNTPGFNGKPAGPLFSDHSDTLLSADLCNKLMHDDVSFGSFLSNLKNYQVMFGVIISKFMCGWKDGRCTVYVRNFASIIFRWQKVNAPERLLSIVGKRCLIINLSMLVMDLAKNIRCIVKSQYKLKCHHPRAVFYGNWPCTVSFLRP